MWAKYGGQFALIMAWVRFTEEFFGSIVDSLFVSKEELFVLGLEKFGRK